MFILVQEIKYWLHLNKHLQKENPVPSWSKQYSISLLTFLFLGMTLKIMHTQIMVGPWCMYHDIEKDLSKVTMYM